MIQQQTKVKVRDNSGAKLVKCIKVLGGFKKKKAFTGDLIIVSIIKLRNKFKITSKVKKGELYKAIIIRTNKKNKKNKKKDGSYSYFFENSICLLNNQEKPIASRIIGPIPKQFKKTRLKLINIASGSFS
jgi:large subunit ribosomal protein L14